MGCHKKPNQKVAFIFLYYNRNNTSFMRKIRINILRIQKILVTFKVSTLHLKNMKNVKCVKRIKYILKQLFGALI